MAHKQSLTWKDKFWGELVLLTFGIILAAIGTFINSREMGIIGTLIALNAASLAFLYRMRLDDQTKEIRGEVEEVVRKLSVHQVLGKAQNYGEATAAIEALGENDTVWLTDFANDLDPVRGLPEAAPLREAWKRLLEKGPNVKIRIIVSPWPQADKAENRQEEVKQAIQDWARVCEGKRCSVAFLEHEVKTWPFDMLIVGKKMALVTMLDDKDKRALWFQDEEGVRFFRDTFDRIWKKKAHAVVEDGKVNKEEKGKVINESEVEISVDENYGKAYQLISQLEAGDEIIATSLIRPDSAWQKAKSLYYKERNHQIAQGKYDFVWAFAIATEEDIERLIKTMQDIQQFAAENPTKGPLLVLRTLLCPPQDRNQCLQDMRFDVLVVTAKAKHKDKIKGALLQIPGTSSAESNLSAFYYGSNGEKYLKRIKAYAESVIRKGEKWKVVFEDGKVLIQHAQSGYRYTIEEFGGKLKAELQNAKGEPNYV